MAGLEMVDVNVNISKVSYIYFINLLLLEGGRGCNVDGGDGGTVHHSAGVRQVHSGPPGG